MDLLFVMMFFFGDGAFLLMTVLLFVVAGGLLALWPKLGGEKTEFDQTVETAESEDDQEGEE